MHKIVIAGAGQLGSRYLQGLAKLGGEMQIYVQDIMDASLDRARMRWEEAIGGIPKQHQVFFVKDFSALPQAVDVAIISTAADVRPAVVQALASVTNVRFWILEKVLTQDQQGLDALRAIVNRSEGAWVNTSRRMMEWHNRIRTAIGAAGPVILSVTGGGWGLASNAIHFLDMLGWWTGEQLEEINTDKLEDRWIESKRTDFFEIRGTLKATFSGGSTAALTVTSDMAPLIMQVKANGSRWVIDELKGEAHNGDVTVNGKIQPQSELTGTLIAGLLTDGTCMLPRFNEAAAMHSIFIEALRKHWNHRQLQNAQVLPIT
jgi:hypothetical protein